MPKKRVNYARIKSEALSQLNSISRGLSSQPIEHSVERLMGAVRNFFMDLFQMQPNFTLSDVHEEFRKKGRFGAKTLEQAEQFLDQFSENYYSEGKKEVASVRKSISLFRKLVMMSVRRKPESGKGKKQKKQVISGAKKLLRKVSLSLYDTHIRDIISGILSAKSALKKGRVGDAQKIYGRLKTRYSVLPRREQAKVYDRVAALEREIRKKYYDLLSMKLEKAVDTGHRNLSSKKTALASRNYSGALKLFHELPEKKRSSYSEMMDNFLQKLEKARAEDAVAQIKEILSEVMAMNRRYSMKEMDRIYGKALKSYRMLGKKEKAELFPAMKEIKKKNDITFIIHSVEVISRNIDRYRQTGKFDEKRMLKLYFKAKDRYSTLDERSKLDNYEIIGKTHSRLIETFVDIRIRAITDRLAKYKKRPGEKKKLMELYKELGEFYRQLPDDSMKKVYSIIVSLYEKIRMLG